MYLTRPMVLAVLNDLRRHVASFAISFDYLSEAVIAHTTGDGRVSAFVQRFADMGAPWHFGVDDLDGLAREAGMSVVDNAREADSFAVSGRTSHSMCLPGTRTIRCARSRRRDHPVGGL